MKNLKLTRKRFILAVFASAFLLMASKTYADLKTEEICFLDSMASKGLFTMHDSAGRYYPQDWCSGAEVLLADSDELCNWIDNQYWCPPYPSETDISWDAFVLSNQFAYSSFRYIYEYLIQIENGNSVNTTDLYESFVYRFLSMGPRYFFNWQYDIYYEELMSPRVKFEIQDNFIHPTLNFLMSRPHSSNLQINLKIYADSYHFEKKAICFLDSMASKGLFTMHDSAGRYYPQDWCSGAEVTIFNN